MKKKLLSCILLLVLIGHLMAQKSEQSLIVLRAELPSYPPLAKEARISGTVKVIIAVRDGLVTDIQVKSSAHRILVQATVENIKTWAFLPTTNARIETTYIYEIEKEEAPVPENPKIEMQLPTFVKLTVRPAKRTTNG